jgi:hypothetical protein
MKNLILSSMLFPLVLGAASADTLVAMADVVADPVWNPNLNQGVASKDYLTTIDGIATTITFSTSVNNVWIGSADGGIMGIDGGTGAIPGIESRAGEILTITLTPTTATGITYTVNSGVLVSAGASSQTITMAFTDAPGTTTYASAMVSTAAKNSGMLAFSSPPSGVDGVSFTLRQTAESADTTEGGFLGSFTVSAVATPSAEIKVNDVSFDAGELTVKFQSASGSTYSVFGGTDLSDVGAWPEISTMDLVGNDAELSFSYTPPGQPPAFFLRVGED